jgi:phospholipase/carboxylesterase
MDLLPHIEIEPKQTANASVIWLHGLGADGHDFEPIVPELKLPEETAIRFIFPHAPSIPVTINNGYVMPAWYDILEMNIERKIDNAQLMASSEQINQFIEREISRGIAPERIILIGFSQGGAVAYQTALSHPKKLGGLLALSTYFATEDTIEFNDANKKLPIFIHHGVMDPVVPDLLGRKANRSLKNLGYDVKFNAYEMEHSVCYEQIADIQKILLQLLS